MAETAVLTVIVLLPIGLGIAARRFIRRARQRGARGPRLLIGNVLVLATLLAAAVVALEGYYRFAYDETDSWGLTRVARRWVERHVHYNGAGVRDDIEYSMQRTSLGRRVTFFGDSFTAGHGVRNVNDRFANRIRRERPNWDVHVMARLGYDTPQLVEFVHELREQRYEFDVVVLVYCLNDIGQAVPGSNQVIEDVYHTTDDEGLLLRTSYAFNTLYYRHRWRSEPVVANYFEFVRDHYCGAAWEAQQRTLDAFCQGVEGTGARVVAVTFPFLHRLDGSYDFGDAHAALDAHWKSRGVPHLDLLDTFQSHNSENLTVNRYDAHPNERAHEIAADVICTYLDRQLAR